MKILNLEETIKLVEFLKNYTLTNWSGNEFSIQRNSFDQFLLRYNIDEDGSHGYYCNMVKSVSIEEDSLKVIVDYDYYLDQTKEFIFTDKIEKKSSEIFEGFLKTS